MNIRFTKPDEKSFKDMLSRYPEGGISNVILNLRILVNVLRIFSKIRSNKS